MPYAAGTTARTVPAGDLRISAPVYPVPQGLFLDSTIADNNTNYLAFDFRVRSGLSKRADIGFRAFGGGATLEYKRRVAGAQETGSALALQGGAGVINNGNHIYFEGGAIASAAPSRTFVPYGGVRAMQVLPIGIDAAADTPTLGSFVGVRIGDADLGFSSEVGVYYDKPAFDVKARRVHVIPSITLHGSRLIEALSSGPS